jgi:hypothetical protein
VKTDLYSRAVLTVIAAALIYLCAVLSPLPSVGAQQQVGLRPGDDTGPLRVAIVAWQVPESGPTIPVRVLSAPPVEIRGTVETHQRPESVARIIVSGWEENAAPGKVGALIPLRREMRINGEPAGIPVTTIGPAAPK